jgi:electron transfer flavoprotein beta subunit
MRGTAPNMPMKIAVAVKQVAALDKEFDLEAEGSAVAPDALEWSLNEWDEYSLEAGLTLRDAGETEVLVVTVGRDESEEALLTCLAKGADRAVRIDNDSDQAHQDPLAIARVLAEFLRRESPDLVLCGAQSSDGRSGATGAALAGLLDLPRVAVVTELWYESSSRRLEVARELEGGLVERLSLALPALVTLQTGINQPRHPNLRAIKLARSKPRQVLSLRDLGLEAQQVNRAAGARLRRLVSRDASRRAQMIEGSPCEVAQKIAELVANRMGT